MLNDFPSHRNREAILLTDHSLEQTGAAIPENGLQPEHGLLNVPSSASQLPWDYGPRLNLNLDADPFDSGVPHNPVRVPFWEDESTQGGLETSKLRFPLQNLEFETTLDGHTCSLQTLDSEDGLNACKSFFSPGTSGSQGVLDGWTSCCSLKTLGFGTGLEAGNSCHHRLALLHLLAADPEVESSLRSIEALHSPPFRCSWPECRARTNVFSSRPDLDHHLMTYHRLRCPDPACHTRKPFGRKSDLTRHQRSIHSRSRKHRCHVPGCDRAFARSDKLTDHKKTHTRYPPPSSDSLLSATRLVSAFDPQYAMDPSEHATPSSSSSGTSALDFTSPASTSSLDYTHHEFSPSNTSHLQSYAPTNYMKQGESSPESAQCDLQQHATSPFIEQQVYGQWPNSYLSMPQGSQVGERIGFQDSSFACSPRPSDENPASEGY